MTRLKEFLDSQNWITFTEELKEREETLVEEMINTPAPEERTLCAHKIRALREFVNILHSKANQEKEE